MVNTPIPHSLKSEAKKAANIIREFSMPSTKVGPDKLIPAGLLVSAEGLAILSVFRVGFLVTARGGSGIVIAKLEDGSWSAPSAIGIAGLGGGFEVGAEVTDFVIILNKRSAVQAFSKGGNLTLGGNFTIAAGPVGRNIEGDVSIRSPAAIYTYSKTKGLFAGISVEGSCLIERKDANKKFYAESVRAVDILCGKIEPPKACAALYEVLENHSRMYERVTEALAKKEQQKQDKLKENEEWGGNKPRPSAASKVKDKLSPRASGVKSVGRSHGRSMFYDVHNIPAIQSRPDVLSSTSQPLMVQAAWGFTGQLPCDLTFLPGDEIQVLTRTHTQEDWWEGRHQSGRVGIFPANYMHPL